MKTDDTKFTKPPTFGDAEQGRLYMRSFDAMRERTRFKYTVAPLCTVTARSGAVLKAGAELRLEDIGHDQAVLAQLHHARVIIVLDDAEVSARNPPKGWTHRVAPGFSTCSNTRGIIGPNEPCSAADFASPAYPEVLEVPAMLLPDGTIKPGRVGRPGRPGSDGKRELADLVARGIVIERGAHDTDDGPLAA